MHNAFGHRFLPANQYVSDSCPLDGAVAAESEARLAVDVLRIANIRAIIAVIDGHVYPCSFRVRLHTQINHPLISSAHDLVLTRLG